MIKQTGIAAGEQIFLRGCLKLALKNVWTGEIVEQRVLNTVVTSGRRWVLEAIQSANAASAPVMQQIAVGTSTTAPATSQTALVAENTRKAVGTWDNAELTSNPPSWQAQVSFATNEANTTLGEVALLNSSSGGTMLNRVTYATIDKTTSNTLSISLTISN